MKATAVEGSWAQMCAGFGALLWAGVAVLARIGVAPIGAIELMFLFAPLVIVPLGMELARVLGNDTPPARFARAFSRLPPRSPSLPCGFHRADWRRVGWRVDGRLSIDDCGWARRSLFPREIPGGPHVPHFIESLFRSRTRSPCRRSLVRGFTVGDAADGYSGANRVADRRPLSLRRICYRDDCSGDAAIRRAARRAGWLKSLVAVVVCMPLVVAVGFVISPLLKMGAAVVFSLSVAALAVVLRSCAKRLESARLVSCSMLRPRVSSPGWSYRARTRLQTSAAVMCCRFRRWRARTES